MSLASAVIRWARARGWPRIPGRATNQLLLLALLAAFGTGAGAVATGSASGHWVVVAHGLAGLAILLLVPWKRPIVGRGLRRPGLGRWVSLVFAVLTLLTIGLGLGYGTGLVQFVAGVRGLWLHVAIALALAPLALWHALARQSRPRRTDFSRRTLLRVGSLTLVAGAGYAGLAATVSLAGLPGARRRFTGSYPAGSFEPTAMPTTIWLDDAVPVLDADWRLTIVDGAGRYQLDLADLEARSVTRRALLDCTSGWYAEQDWTGVPVRALLRDLGGSRSLLVHSVTGYWVRYPLADLDRLLLATRVAGQPLDSGHGYPLRLVAPGRRGYWWVKWVDRIELQAAPSWWQPPFPVT